MISRPSTTSITTMPCWSTRSPASGSAAGAIFRRVANRTAEQEALYGAAHPRCRRPLVTEFIFTYDGVPSYTVSIMEFRDDKVARETQYFGDAFAPGPSRAQWVERMDT